MKRKTDLPGSNEEDAPDDFENYSGFGPNSPKRSSIRRKERFREKELASEMDARSRRKCKRQSIRTDSKFWEE